MIPILICAALFFVARNKLASQTSNTNWRLYRLPGSREFWHIDNGDGTKRIDVTGFDMNHVPSRSVNRTSGVPHSWIEINATHAELRITNGKAFFFEASPICETVKGPEKQTV
jgi:hypothetical protein